jgi:prepilin-type N-terminal cleavage/methylation domain-containing protein
MSIKEWKRARGASKGSAGGRGKTLADASGSDAFRAAGARDAFTLVELLVVITIIAILLALVAGATLRFIGVQQQNNSEVVVRKVNEVLKRQWQAVIDQASKEPLPPTPPALAAAYSQVVLPLAGNDATRARIIWIKLRLKQEFPMNYTEILTPQNLSATPLLQVLPPLPSYVQALTQANVVPGNPPVAGNGVPMAAWPGYAAENSACLLLALSKSRGGVMLNAEDLGSGALADTNKDGLQEIVDAWGTPIIFYRWPWANTDLQSLNPAVGGSAQSFFADPEDPTGLLITPNPFNPYPNLVQGAWFNTPYRLIFEFLCHSVSAPNSNSPPPPLPPLPPFPTEYYLVPVVASAGKNKSFGLFAAYQSPAVQPGIPAPYWPNPMLADGTGDDNDNIYSYRLR